MTPADYDALSRYLQRSSGLALGSGKEYLLESRLLPVAQSWNLKDLSELVVALVRGDERLGRAVVEAMTTNETSFFRDKLPFEELRNVLLPALIESRRISRRLRIWSAAASTGQESYSIAMLLEDHFPELSSWSIEIVGTDISPAALERAASGMYSQLEVQRGLGVQQLVKHFEQTKQGWRVKENLQKRVYWKHRNLLNDFSDLGQFDVVFCRNVLIYFDMPTKADILSRLSHVVRDDGYLFLGAAETVLGISDRFERFSQCNSAVYTRNSNPEAPCPPQILGTNVPDPARRSF